MSLSIPLSRSMLAYRLDDLSAHLNDPSSIRLPRTIASYGMSKNSSVSGLDRHRVLVRLEDGSAELAAAIDRLLRAQRDLVAQRLPKMLGVRSGRSMPGEETSTA